MSNDRTTALQRIEELALCAIATDSRDRGDWRDDILTIISIAQEALQQPVGGSQKSSPEQRAGFGDATAATGVGQPDTLRQSLGALLSIGSAALTDDVILINVQNLQRRAACLWAVEHAFFMTTVPADEDEGDTEPGEWCALPWGADPVEYVEAFRKALAAATAAQQPQSVLAAAERLLRAVRAEMSPRWTCNSYHPTLAPAADALGRALAAAPAAAQAQPLSSLGVAGIAHKHFGNPIPHAAYAFAAEIAHHYGTGASAAPVHWRHKRTRGIYVELMRGHLQTSDDLDMELVVVYRSEVDGAIWVRPVAEFEDGRFERVAVPTKEQS